MHLMKGLMIEPSINGKRVTLFRQLTDTAYV